MLKMGHGLPERLSSTMLSICKASDGPLNDAVAIALPETSCAQAMVALGDTFRVWEMSCSSRLSRGRSMSRCIFKLTAWRYW